MYHANARIFIRHAKVYVQDYLGTLGLGAMVTMIVRRRREW